MWTKLTGFNSVHSVKVLDIISRFDWTKCIALVFRAFDIGVHVLQLSFSSASNNQPY
jgi:hypothetical protein